MWNAISGKNEEIRIENNAMKVLQEFKSQAIIGMMAIGATAEKYAKRDCPVDTGRLRNSISNKIQEDGIYIGTNVKYAKYMEFGDKYQHTTGKAHFLRDAATQHNEKYKSLMKEALKK